MSTEVLSSPEAPKADDFEKKIDSLKFDEQVVADEMYENLSKAGGYSLIRGEILKTQDASGMKMSKADFETYLNSQPGGRRNFLKEIFAKGIVGLRNDFRRQKAEFPARIGTILNGVEAESNGFSTEEYSPDLDIFLLNKRNHSFYKSKFAKKIVDAAQDQGIGKLEIGKFDFDQALSSGKVFGEYLQPSMKGVAEYGLSWFEYKNRKQREAKLKRYKVSEEAGKVDTPDLDATKREAEDQKVETPVPSPRPIAEVPEARTKPKTRPEAQKELREVIAPKVEELIKKYSKYGLTSESLDGGKGIAIKKGDEILVSVLIVNGGPDGPLFSVSQEGDYSLPGLAAIAISTSLRKKLEKIDADEAAKLEDAEAAKKTREQAESEEWFTKATQAMDSLVKKYGKEGGVQVDGNRFNVYLSRNSQDTYTIIIDGHKSCTIKLNKEKMAATVIAGQMNIVTDKQTEIKRNILIGELNIDKKTMEEESGLELWITIVVPRKYKLKEEHFITELLDKELEDDLK